jgi:hypothetical protein
VWKAGRKGERRERERQENAKGSRFAPVLATYLPRFLSRRGTRLLSPREVMKITCSDARLRLFPLRTKAGANRFPRDTSIPRMNSRLKSTIRPCPPPGCSSASNCSRRPISDKSMRIRSVSALLGITLLVRARTFSVDVTITIDPRMHADRTTACPDLRILRLGINDELSSKTLSCYSRDTSLPTRHWTVIWCERVR